MASVHVIEDEDRLGEDLVLIVPEQRQHDHRAAVAQVHQRRDERLKRQILDLLKGSPSTTAAIAGHIHRSLSWTRQALLGLRVTETAPDTWQLDDEVEQ